MVVVAVLVVLWVVVGGASGVCNGTELLGNEGVGELNTADMVCAPVLSRQMREFPAQAS